jgi:hypothetical protein
MNLPPILMVQLIVLTDSRGFVNSRVKESSGTTMTWEIQRTTVNPRYPHQSNKTLLSHKLSGHAFLQSTLPPWITPCQRLKETVSAPSDLYFEQQKPIQARTASSRLSLQESRATKSMALDEKPLMTEGDREVAEPAPLGH